MTKKVPKATAKGHVLERPSPWFIVPLIASQTDPLFSIYSQLPKYDEVVRPQSITVEFQKTKTLVAFISRVLSSTSLAAHVLVVTMEICLRRDNSANDMVEPSYFGKEPSEISWSNEQEHEMIYEGWVLIQESVSWVEFQNTYIHVRRHLHIASYPHPLMRYMTQVFPLLSTSEQVVAVEILKRCVSKKYEHVPTVALIHAVVSTYEQRPSLFAFLLHPPHVSKDSTKILHSCLPNCEWYIDDASGRVRPELVAIYDLEENEDVSISLIENALPYKGRVDALLERYGSQEDVTCDCCRCKYERSGELPLNKDAQRLGHLCFQRSCYGDAERLYRHALKQDRQLPDIWHAIGAIYLEQQHFVKAQLHWKDAVEQHDFLAMHEGIALQLEKQSAYRYWDCEHQTNTKPIALPKTTSFFQGLCFTTKNPVVSTKDCKSIVAWAEQASGGWTTSRHYAVPTTDVPVHKAPPLLQWFLTWMKSKVCPLLSSQFEHANRKRWYVHDAFVARYESFHRNNYLPLHCDESTHSFVLSLNDDYQGGGTYFDSHDQTLTASAGHMIAFRGDVLRHGGNVVTDGIRYILAVFLYLDDVPELRSSPETYPSPKRAKLNHLFETKRNKCDDENNFSFSFDIPARK